MLAKIINMQGEDISPLPPTFEEEFGESLLNLLQSSLPLDVVVESLFQQYNITAKQN